MREVLEEKGTVIAAESKWGQALTVASKDQVVERVDIAEVLIPAGREPLLLMRLQLHLVSDFGVYFELTPKPKRGLGKVFAPGEGRLGIEVVDEHLWVETPMPKQVVKVFQDPRVQKAVSAAFERRSLKEELLSILVMGNRIQVLFRRKKILIEILYYLALTIAHHLDAAM